MSGKYTKAPEGFTRNGVGEVIKGSNERRKTVAGVLYQETKNIKRPKKNANVRQHKKEVADSKNHYDGVMTERMALNKPYEEHCIKNGYTSFRKFEKLGDRASKRRK